MILGNSLKKIETMDVNDDQTISVTELNRYLLQDGIIYERYLESISDYERCRAAAMLTFLIRFQKKPKVSNITLNLVPRSR